MNVNRKYGARKMGAFALVFVILLNTLTGALAPIYAAASENTKSILTEVHVTDETGNVLGESQNEAASITSADDVLIAYDWSLTGVDAQADDTFSYLLPMQLQVKETQQGSLLSDEGVEIATYQVNLDGTVAILFNAAAADHPEASGSLTIQAGFDADVIAEATETTLLFQLAGTEKTVLLQFAQTTPAAEPEATEAPQPEAAGAEAEQPAASTPALMARSLGYSAQVITENLITDVDLLQRLPDGTEVVLVPGEEITVANPFDVFQVAINYSFALPNGHSYGDGSTYTIVIPEVFKVLPNPEATPLKSQDGTVFGTFVVTSDREIVITFNENIEDWSDISGYIKLFSEFDAHYKGQADTEINFLPVSGGATLTYPIKFIPNANAIAKVGVPDKAYNTMSITWTVDLNKNLSVIKDAVVTDAAAVGAHTFKAGSLKVYKLSMNADGTIDETKTVEVADHGFGDAFPLQLGTIDSAYRLVYETVIQDDAGTSYRNNVSLSGSNQEPVSAQATVAVKRGIPLDKTAKAYDSRTQTISWEVKYNYNEKAIPQDKALLTDTFGSNQKLVYTSTPKDGFTVYRVTIDPNTGAETGQEAVDNYTITKTDTGFSLQFNDALTSAYKIVYKTTAENRVEAGLSVKNSIIDGFGNKDEATQGIGQQVLLKANNSGKTNYNNKTTGWTITLNGDEYTMTGVNVTDTLPAGFTPRDLVITHNGQTWTAGNQYTWAFDANTRQLTIAFTATVSKKVVISYTTDINHDQTKPETNGSYKNSVHMTWANDGSSGSGESNGSATFNPDTYTKANGFKGAAYNLATKVIDWKIGVNYNKATLQDVVVEDVITGNQNFDSASIHVYRMNLTGSANGYTAGAELTRGDSQNEGEYEVVTYTGLNGEPAFRVKLGDITTPYLITYQTDLQDQLVEKTYTNTAIVKSDQPSFELKTTVSPSYGGEYTKKQAAQDAANPRIVNWSVNINYAQSTVSNVTLTDTPSKNQAIRKDSVRLYATTTTASQIQKGAVLEEGKDYTIVYKENTDGSETFTLAFTDKQIERAYILEYQTYILYKNDGYISNDATFNGEETVGVPTDSAVRERIQMSGIEGGIDGKVGSLEVTKVDAKTKATLAGATFTLYDKTGTVALRTYVTGEDGKAVFNNLLYGDYILKEAGAPEGYVVGIKDQQTATVDAEKSTLTIANKKIIRAVELTKTDKETGAVLEGAVFELQQKVGDTYKTVANLTTDKDGIIYRGDLEAGEYRFVEIVAPEGYQKLAEPIVFTIAEKQTEATKVKAENLKLGSVTLIKFNADDAKETLKGAEFKLLREDGKVIHPILRTDDDGQIFVANLQPGKYKFVETKAPNAFQLNADPIAFELKAVETQTVQVKAPNELVTGNVRLTKTDGTSGEVLAGAVFTLFNEKDEVIKENLTTDAEGNVLVEDLKPGDYYFVETKAPTDYQLDAEKLTFTIERSGSTEKQKAVTVSAENELIPGSVVLTKVDKHSAAKLADAVFELQDADGNVLQKDLTTDAAGQISITDLRPGSYQLVETKAPDYYQLLKEKIVFVIENSQEEALQLTAENELIRGQVLLTKTDADNADAPLAGAVFALQTADGKVIQAELTSDKDGTISVKDLLPGDYRFVETEAPFGYDLDATLIPFTIAKARMTADVKTVNAAASNVLTTGSVELTKVDRDNAGQPLAEVVFALQDATGKTLQTGLVTDTEGKIMVEGLKPGNYQFVETEAPFGYDLDATPIPFVIELGPTTTVQVQAENELTTGSVELIKVDRDDETLPVAGAVFELRNASGKLLKDKLTTDKDGSIRVTDLKPGDYQFVEIKAPFGYDLDETPILFTIAKGQVETLITTATNELTTGSVVLTKVDKHDPERVLTGAEFRLETETGEIIREGLTTDKDGELHVDDLKPGNYRFIETKAPQHYQLDETPIAFTIAKGQEIALTILAKNELITGDVVVTKVDAADKQHVLAGAHYELQDATGKTVQTDLVTDAEGKISISGLRPGDYQFVETQAPTGYQLDATPVTFTIAYSQEKSLQLTVTNAKMPVHKEKQKTKQKGSLLPDTATDLFNYLLVGVLLLLSGFLFLKKNKSQK